MIREATSEVLEGFEKMHGEQQMQVIQDTIHEMMVDYLAYFQTVKDLTDLPMRDAEVKKKLEERGITQESLAKQNYEEVKRVKEMSSRMMKELIESVKDELINTAIEQDEADKGEFRIAERVRKDIGDCAKEAQNQTTELEKKLAKSLDKENKYTDIEHFVLSTHSE